jgi:uncharacterized CHY-type Zn-finger protein
MMGAGVPRAGILIMLATGWLVTGCGEHEPHGLRNLPVHRNPPEVVAVEARQASLPTYPCSSCHDDLEQRPNRRKLVDFHTQRNTELNHGDTEYWCYQCHASKNIDKLVVIASGKLVSFDEAHLLCGSCHGDKLRDWKAAVHGKTMGNWRGEKLRRSCTGCHNPHKPRFQALEPEERPLMPTEMRDGLSTTAKGH